MVIIVKVKSIKDGLIFTVGLTVLESPRRFKPTSGSVWEGGSECANWGRKTWVWVAPSHEPGTCIQWKKGQRKRAQPQPLWSIIHCGVSLPLHGPKSKSSRISCSAALVTATEYIPDSVPGWVFLSSILLRQQSNSFNPTSVLTHTAQQDTGLKEHRASSRWFRHCLLASVRYETHARKSEIC